MRKGIKEEADIPKYVHHNNVNDNDAIIIIIIHIQPMLSTCEKEKLPVTLSLISRMSHVEEIIWNRQNVSSKNKESFFLKVCRHSKAPALFLSLSVMNIIAKVCVYIQYESWFLWIPHL